MSDRNVGDLTPLQRKIVHACASNPNKSAPEIAELVKCSPSYVREVRSQENNIIDEIPDATELDYMPCFSHPYSVLLPEPILSLLYIEEGDVIELTFDVDGEAKTTYGKVKLLPDQVLGEQSEEMQARVNGGYHAGSELQQASFLPFSDLSTLDDGRINFPTDDSLQNFTEKISRITSNTVDNGIQLLIGIGIIEVIHGSRDPSKLISTPYFKLEDRYFPEYLANDGPEMTGFELYLGEISTPDEIIFTCYNESLTDEQHENVRKRIVDYEIFKSSWNYALPNHPNLVGPTTTKSTGDVVRVTDESLNIVTGIRRRVHFKDIESSESSQELDGEAVYRAIRDSNPRFSSLAPHSRHSEERGGLPIRKDEDNLFFLFDQVTLVLKANRDHIVWESPQNIDKIEKIIGAVNNMISEQMGLNESEFGETIKPQYQRVEQQDWVFDTNSLYHDHVANQPTSIIHTLFSHRFFHESIIHIPWPVLFEMNKHPQSGSGTKAANTQGFENLSTLRTLERMGFLSVEVQTPPEEICGNLGNGDVADIHILAYCDINDAQLITADQSLRDIAHLSKTPAVGINQLNSLTSPVDDDSSLRNEVLPRIGSDLHKKDKIITEINSRINQGATVPIPDSSRQSLHDSEAVLSSWQSQEDIIPYYGTTDEGICFAQRKNITVVATKSVLKFLPEYLNNRYLTDEFRNQADFDDDVLTSSDFPAITLTVPTEYVIKNAATEQRPSSFNEKLLGLARAKNITYCTRVASKSEMPLFANEIQNPAHTKTEGKEETFISPSDYSALCLAKDIESSYLLLPSEQQGLWKFTKLLGINTISIPRPTESE